MKIVRTIWILTLAVVFLAGCSGEEPTAYQPPDLGSGADGLSIDDTPLGPDGEASSAFPEPGSWLGFVFQAQHGEVYDISLQRTSGSDVPAIALYFHTQAGWGQALAWASADAQHIAIGGWQVPQTGTYLVLVDLASGSGNGTFEIRIDCSEGCGDPVVCAANADCPAGQVCWNGLCFDDGVECVTDADCPTGELCDQGFCVEICLPSMEICGDRVDNDCDGLVDEDCGYPCTSDADCPAGAACINGECSPFCGCADDADCPVGTRCVDCQCMADTCTSDSECAPGEVCQAGLCVPACQPNVELCDGLDNDCDGLVDEDFDFAHDPANCGACGQMCAAGEACSNGVCQAGLPCTSDADCPGGYLCEAGQCTEICLPSIEICGDRVDNDCDGLVDEDCGYPCTSDSDCPAGAMCIDGQCSPFCGCASDADCPMGNVCVDCECVPDACDTDADLDGYLAATCGGNDCDDYDATVHPGAPEDCNGLDDDCDGQVDEGCTTVCSSDADCAPGEICYAGLCVFACRDDSECPAGQACVGGLCTTTCQPQPEICDGIDNDCDGMVDEGFDLLSDPANCGACGQACAAGEACVNATCVPDQGCLSDADCALDELCVNNVCVAACDTDADGDGFLANTCGGTDCDDYNPAVHPGAEEFCDGIDDDCDGQVDDNCTLYCRMDSDCAAGQICVAGVCVGA